MGREYATEKDVPFCSDDTESRRTYEAVDFISTRCPSPPATLGGKNAVSCFDSWMGAQCGRVERSLRFLIPAIGEMSQLSFGARRNTGELICSETAAAAQSARRSARTLLPSLFLFCPPATGQRRSLGDQGRREPAFWLLSASKVPL